MTTTMVLAILGGCVVGTVVGCVAGVLVINLFESWGERRRRRDA